MRGPMGPPWQTGTSPRLRSAVFHRAESDSKDLEDLVVNKLGMSKKFDPANNQSLIAWENRQLPDVTFCPDLV